MWHVDSFLCRYLSSTGNVIHTEIATVVTDGGLYAESLQGAVEPYIGASLLHMLMIDLLGRNSLASYILLSKIKFDTGGIRVTNRLRKHIEMK